MTTPDHVGLDPEGAAQPDERRVADDELLVRRRRERERVVLGEERLACLQVEGNGRGSCSGDVGDGERLRQALAQRRAAGTGGRRDDERRKKDEWQTASGHPGNSSEGEHGRQA